MTSRERVTALLRRDLPDRMGLFDHYWGETIRDGWLQQGYPPETDPGDYFGYDIAFSSWGLDAMPFRGVDETVEESDEWVLRRNGGGAVMRYWKHKSGTPEHVDFDCITPERWEAKYKPPLLKFDPERINVDAACEGLERARAKEKFSVYGGTFVFEWLRYILGDVVMMESLALEPAWIHDFCRTYTDFTLRHLTYLFDEAGQPDGAFIYEDLGYNKGLFCSPAMYRELILPYHKELFAFFHDRGMPVILHSCGNVTAAVPGFIEAGIDCLQPMEAKSGMDVIALAKEYGDRISFMGNIDVRALESGSREEIEAEIAGKMQELKALGAAYFFHTDHSISPLVSFDAYKFALEVYRAHCQYHA